MTVAPGTVCPTCERRVNHPKKETSPVTRVKNFRVPLDDETFDDDMARAMAIVGVRTTDKYPPYKFLRFVADVINRDEDEWAGSYVREYEGVGS